MKAWADKAARIRARQYAMINEELKDDGFQPPRRVRMTLKKMDGVAHAGGSRITGAVAYFKKHPDDFGAMVHETVHIVQSYRKPGNPGWLVEGIADYVRFFKYEPGKLGRINPRRARYDGSYRVTAAFLAYLTAKYDKDIVRELNKLMRAGEYKKEAFQKWTGKTLEQLGDEWRATLGGSASARSSPSCRPRLLVCSICSRFQRGSHLNRGVARRSFGLLMHDLLPRIDTSGSVTSAGYILRH